MDEKQRIWNSVLGEIELNISKAQFNTWIKNTYPVSMDEKEIVICVPSSFTRDWLQNKFNTTILNSIQKITGQVKQVRYVVQGAMPPKNNQIQSVINLKQDNLSKQAPKKQKPEQPAQQQKPEPQHQEQARPNYQASAPAQPQYQAPQAHVHQQHTYTPPGAQATPQQPMSMGNRAQNIIKQSYTFDTFIVGSSNQLAYAAAQAVANSPGTLYNPLFIYGGVGLGKTHLIQAIANQVVLQGRNVLYVTSDEFISDLMRSIGGKTMDDFKRRYRDVDLLIIDDIQFIKGKEGTQHEVFNTFNELYNLDKQIVFTSDRPPSAIQQLSDRLKSRFEQGMIVDVTTPDFETRFAILKRKCEQKNFHINNDVLAVIADKVRSNVRELEGALNKIIGHVSLLKIDVTPELVDRLIEGSKVHTQRSINEDAVIDTVVEHFNITRDGIMSKSRKKEFAHPRQICMYLLREELKLTFPNIGGIMGGRDHTTVMHAHTKIKKELEKRGDIEQDMNLVKNKLYNEG